MQRRERPKERSQVRSTFLLEGALEEEDLRWSKDYGNGNPLQGRESLVKGGELLLSNGYFIPFSFPLSYTENW